jgi:hypothetical protein
MTGDRKRNLLRSVLEFIDVDLRDSRYEDCNEHDIVNKRLYLVCRCYILTFQLVWVEYRDQLARNHSSIPAIV